MKKTWTTVDWKIAREKYKPSYLYVARNTNRYSVTQDGK